MSPKALSDGGGLIIRRLQYVYLECFIVHTYTQYVNKDSHTNISNMWNTKINEACVRCGIYSFFFPPQQNKKLGENKNSQLLLALNYIVIAPWFAKEFGQVNWPICSVGYGDPKVVGYALHMGRNKIHQRLLGKDIIDYCLSLIPGFGI